MTQFVGTKIIKATPMNRFDYNTYRGWEVPADEDPEDEGFMVEYLDGGKPNVAGHEGYISWSPAEQFEAAYHKSGEMSFGDAVMLAKRGAKVARSGWNGAGMFVYIVGANYYPAQSEAIKGTYLGDMVPYSDYWAIKTAQGYVSTWAPSCNDSLAEDWCIVA